jgi:hypothetical protein
MSLQKWLVAGGFVLLGLLALQRGHADDMSAFVAGFAVLAIALPATLSVLATDVTIYLALIAVSGAAVFTGLVSGPGLPVLFLVTAVAAVLFSCALLQER